MRPPGGVAVARAIVARHAHRVSCELARCTEVVPDKGSIEDELLDEYPPTVAFHDAIRSGEDLDAVRHRWQAAKHELDETFFKYVAHRTS